MYKYWIIYHLLVVFCFLYMRRIITVFRHDGRSQKIYVFNYNWDLFDAFVLKFSERFPYKSLYVFQ